MNSAQFVLFVYCSKEWRSRSGEMSGALIFTLAKMNSASFVILVIDCGAFIEFWE